MTPAPTLDELIRFLLDLSEHYTRQGLPNAASKLYRSSDALSHQRHTIIELEAALSQLQRDRDEDRREEEALTDPVAVHANMLRGTVARPTLPQIVHLYGSATLRTYLASTYGDDLLEPEATP